MPRIADDLGITEGLPAAPRGLHRPDPPRDRRYASRSQGGPELRTPWYRSASSRAWLAATNAYEGSGAHDMRDKDITTRPLTKADYDYIVRVIDKWWQGPTNALAHPVYFYELGDLAMVAEIAGRVVGFLLGFIAHRGPTGYVHLVGIHPDFRRQHVGTRLYEGFEKAAARERCASLKAITTLGNEGSVRFHEALGWKVEEVADYAGPGRTRIIFTKSLAN